MFALDPSSEQLPAAFPAPVPVLAPAPAAPRLVARAGQLSQPTAPIPPEASNEDVHRLFSEQPLLETLAVVADDRPLGLINRQRFMEQYARPFARDVFGRRSCMVFTDTAPMVVAAGLPIDQLVQQALASGNRVLKDGFITVEEGRYAGIGTGHALMAAMSDIEADKTRQLMASIDYASLIQRSHLVESDRVLAGQLADHGLLWEPRDVVGGDAYFFRATQQGLLGCMFDCTGHGVPGAFMTLIALSFLEQAVAPAGIGTSAAIDPGALLGQMNRYIKRVLQQRSRDVQPAWGAPAAPADGLPAEKTSSDGLDAALFLQSPCGTQLRFASARLDLLVAPPGVQESDQVQIHAGDKLGIGYATTPDDAAWSTQVLEIAPGSLLMVATDGVIDQLGGPRQIAHGRKRLARFLQEQHDRPAAQACAEFRQAFAQWQGTQRRRDDVSLLVWRNQALQPATCAQGQP